MSKVYVALVGEYDTPEPLGAFDSLVTAKMAVIVSAPSYDTSVLEYNTTTGTLVAYHDYTLATKEWSIRNV